MSDSLTGSVSDRAGGTARDRPAAHCGIVPPYLLAELSRSDDAAVAGRAARTLLRDEAVRRARLAPTSTPGPGTTTGSEHPSKAPTRTQAKPAQKDSGDAPQREIHDTQRGSTLPGELVRSEGAPQVADASANEAYDGLGDTWTLYHDVFARDSLDGKGLPLIASVHYERDYDNAFWNGEQMVFGDGDGKIFGSFTSSIDVIGHELTHGVTENTAGLRYQGQSGALNESISDVFGSLVKQRVLGQTADRADWLIGADLLLPSVKGVALRSMSAPGTAYDDPQLGKDPQPASMSGYVDTTSDNGGVHINSGIPNRAFYLVAMAIGGNAWEAPGKIWYAVLTGGPIKADCDFAEFAALTTRAAVDLFGDGSPEQAAVIAAWQTVEVTTASAGGTGQSPAPDAGKEAAVVVTRTGGFAGTSTSRTIQLADVPEAEASLWMGLAQAEPAARPPAAGHPDGFSYEITAPGAQPVTYQDHELPSAAMECIYRAFRS